MKQRNAAPMRHAVRRTAGHAQADHLLDPYLRSEKLADGTVCRQCGAVYHAGRWSWAARPAAAREALCAACRRANDHLPAGTVTLRGAFAREHKEELLRLARHQEQAENREHPQNRIIEISEEPDAIVIATADIHLPRRIGEAVSRAFRGQLDMHFDDNAYFARVEWSPPD
jgi:NMD protein affecting ribosome stability and mRNA decay